MHGGGAQPSSSSGTGIQRTKAPESDKTASSAPRVSDRGTPVAADTQGRPFPSDDSGVRVVKVSANTSAARAQSIIPVYAQSAESGHAANPVTQSGHAAAPAAAQDGGWSVPAATYLRTQADQISASERIGADAASPSFSSDSTLPQQIARQAELRHDPLTLSPAASMVSNHTMTTGTSEPPILTHLSRSGAPETLSRRSFAPGGEPAFSGNLRSLPAGVIARQAALTEAGGYDAVRARTSSPIVDSAAVPDMVHATAMAGARVNRSADPNGWLTGAGAYTPGHDVRPIFRSTQSGPQTQRPTDLIHLDGAVSRPWVMRAIQTSMDPATHGEPGLQVSRQASSGGSAAGTAASPLSNAATPAGGWSHTWAPGGNASSGAAAPDVQGIAEQVYQMLMRRIASERERRGF
jgi:hypothetical protein